MMNTLPHAVLIVTCSSILAINAGCNDATSEPPESVAQTVEESRPAFDLEATMNELAATLELRATLSRQAAENPESVDRAMADRFSDMYYTEWVMIQRIKTQMEEEPSWIPNICEWYDAVLREPAMKQDWAFGTAFAANGPLGTSAAVRIYGDEVSQQDLERDASVRSLIYRAARKKFDSEFPNPRFKKFKDTIDLYVFCVKMRMIEQ